MKQELNEDQLETVNGGCPGTSSGTFVLRMPEEDNTTAPEPSVWERLFSFLGFRTK